MSRVKRFIENYYVRPLYSKNAFNYAFQGCLALAFLCALVFLATFNNHKEFHTYTGVITIIFLIFALLNFLGMRYYVNTKSQWLKLPYITTMVAILVAYISLVLASNETIKPFVVWYPILFPLLSWVWQFIFFDKLKGEEQKKLKALILSIPILTAIFVMGVGVFLDTFGNFEFLQYPALGATGIAFFSLELPMWFTKTSEYWHPELKQSRYDEAMGALQQTKKSKKTGKKKKKMKLKK
ncbi:hypothetical protein MK541_04625 [Streptococcus gallolyticus subsp. gallolyticus]|uniref:hypothetical protein n=1 Tax=Streptococcus gallolyticus TaxID=315405 RepID=UPI0022849629|nr:hypothetical protein [Streptococcus gallolyticus]MCY7151461.1 hypothetical protein [Streptococcus gallolyticus subsp. gallolyticus]